MVNGVFKATCCTRKATISVLDVAGNAINKEFDNGPLRGSFLKETKNINVLLKKILLKKISFFSDCGRVSVCNSCVTESEVTVDWSCPCSDWTVEKYEFTFIASDGALDFSHNSYCESKNIFEYNLLYILMAFFLIS
jgi:hypothetical protein